jgi:hypothetical protein
VEDDDIVSSIVVVPLLVNAQQFGGLYVTHEQPWSEGPGFAKAKELLVGLGAMLQRQLGQHLAGQPGAAWVDLLEVNHVFLPVRCIPLWCGLCEVHTAWMFVWCDGAAAGAAPGRAAWCSLGGLARGGGCCIV